MKVITRDKSFYKTLIALAIPAALQNLISFLVTFADNLMVSPLGDAAVSGVYMGGQVQTFLQVFTVGIEGTIVILSSQYWGKGEKEPIKTVSSTGLHFSLATGIVIMTLCLIMPDKIVGIFTDDASVIESGTAYLQTVCLSYPFFCLTQSLVASMRSVETARLGMVVSLFSLTSDVILNYLLIEGHFGCPALGTRGAALATLASRIIETAVTLIFVLKLDKKLRFRLRDFLRTDSALRRDFIRYGLPLVGGQVIWAINLMGNSVIMGHFDREVITAVSMANTMNTLAYVVMNGMSGAVGIITGKTIGAGKTELVKEYARTVQIIFLCLGFLTGGTIALLKAPFISLYSGVSAEAASFSRQFITVLSITAIGTCYQAAGLFGLVKSGGDVSFVFRNDSIFVLGVVLPSAIIASHLGAAPWIVYACLKCDQILKCFVAVVKINRFNWMKNLTRNTLEERTEENG